ncbi:FHA domain-containing protein [Cutibacterium equinum]|uniref:FHA domain-containing protein n=1 Tax=Cutibacterium equinum TaxID=3016342 RepID=A0ABY7QYI8_9ACTN|nr:FHA domain-containing protein [Cutibacterium equinum]WCC80111.1 FHA domain-containing protein [Cutibacterium equinum]
MSEFLVAVLRIAYLAVLWIFILLVTNVIRTDIYGHRVPRNAETVAVAPRQRHKGRKSRKARRREVAAAPSGLQVISGTRAGTYVPLANGVTVGRGNDCTLPIDDDYASTRHAEFSPGIDGAWFVEDLASTNGTHVNGERIENPTRLSVGDEVRIGRTVMTVTGGR